MPTKKVDVKAKTGRPPRMPKLTFNGIRSWALMLIARGESTGDLDFDNNGYAIPLDADDCRSIADAALRGDQKAVCARTPAGLTWENAMSICQGIH